MKAFHFAAMAFALLAGCGPWSTSPPATCDAYSCPSTWTDTSGVTPYADFLIDAGAAIELPQTTLGITTNGQGDWVLAWQGDRFAHQFHGTVYCSATCQIAYARFDGAYPGDSAQITAPNRIDFQGVTNAAVPQNLLIRMVPAQGVSFDLYIDNKPAIYDVVFPSNGYLATTDAMPFTLWPSTLPRPRDSKMDKAPSFVAKPPKDGVERVITVAAPPANSQSADK